MKKDYDVIIVGAGLSGLAAALKLEKAGMRYLLLEKEDRVGGKLKTDKVDGFILDRGFQTVYTAYPELSQIVDFNDLNMRFFNEGTYIMKDGKSEIFANPLKHPSQFLRILKSKVALPWDYFRLLKLRFNLRNLTETEIFDKYEAKSSTVWRKRYFSKRIIQNVLQPLFSGIFLEDDMITSRRSFEFFYQMMNKGRTGFPALGMEEIPKHIEKQLDPENIRRNAEVKRVDDQQITLSNGETITGEQIIVTVPAPVAKEILDNSTRSEYHSTTCLYFKSPKHHGNSKMVFTNANKVKLVNNVAIISNVAPERAPVGYQLIQCSINGLSTAEDETLVKEVVKELAPYFRTHHWEFIKSYRIQDALPDQTSVLGTITRQQNKAGDHLWLTGDYFMYGSSNAAVKGGRLIADFVLKEMKKEQTQKRKDDKYSRLFE
jgi:protoporphyrinogen oxidase